jgi:hypothetical protein
MGITRAQLDGLRANLPLGCYLCGGSVAHFVGAIERAEGDDCTPGSFPSSTAGKRLIFYRLCELCRDRPGSAAEVAQKMTPGGGTEGDPSPPARSRRTSSS